MKIFTILEERLQRNDVVGFEYDLRKIVDLLKSKSTITPYLRSTFVNFLNYHYLNGDISAESFYNVISTLYDVTNRKHK